MVPSWEPRDDDFPVSPVGICGRFCGGYLELLLGNILKLGNVPGLHAAVGELTNLTKHPGMETETKTPSLFGSQETLNKEQKHLLENAPT